MKEKISRNKISRHYKSFFGLENMGLGKNDNLMIDWGESLVNDFCNQEVEKRIAERMPSEEAFEDLQTKERQRHLKMGYNVHELALIKMGIGIGFWGYRSRLTQKTEGGEG